MATDKKKLAGKYETPEDLEAAYAELEKKLGEQGKQLGDVKALQDQVQQFQAALGQYQEWAKGAQPIVDWYTKNEGEVKRRWALADAGGNGNGNGASGAQAAAIAQNQPGFQWLTPEEKASLIDGVQKQLLTAHLNPWSEAFAKRVEDFGRQQVAALQNQQRAHTQVLWQTLQAVLPPDKIEWAKKWHEEALKFADPSKLDPMATAQEFLSLRGDHDRLKTELDDTRKKLEEREKQSVPSLTGGPSPSLITKDETPPATREERMQRAMDTVKTEHGPEGMAALFPSLAG